MNPKKIYRMMDEDMIKYIELLKKWCEQEVNYDLA